MSRIIWAMKQLHHTEGIIRLAQLEQDSIRLADGSGATESRFESLIKALKSFVDDDLPIKINVVKDIWGADPYGETRYTKAYSGINNPYSLVLENSNPKGSHD